jgi:hypothetical protein
MVSFYETSLRMKKLVLSTLHTCTILLPISDANRTRWGIIIFYLHHTDRKWYVALTMVLYDDILLFLQVIQQEVLALTCEIDLFQKGLR